MPPTASRSNPASLDPNSGMLCHVVYWRPRPSDPDPDMPGEKASALTLIPVADRDVCLCGSGKQFRDCCKVKPYWLLICPDADYQNYSLWASQSATFTQVNGSEIAAKLIEDERLQCIENTRARAFWTYWGAPALLAPEGTLCFGDIELIDQQTLVVTALSNKRMEILLALLRELFGDSLGEAQIQYDEVKHVPKPAAPRKTRNNRRKR